MNACRQSRRDRTGRTLLCDRGLDALICITVLAALIATMHFTTSHAHAEGTRGSAELEAKLDTPGTLMLRKATLADWAFAIKQEWDINIVSGANLQNEVVDAGFEETPLRDILSEILYVRGYGFQAVGNSLRIVKLEDLGAMRPGFETSIIPLDLLQPNEVEPSVKMLASAGATVQAVPSSRSLIVIDTPEKILKIQAHLEALENNARKHAERLGLGGSNINSEAAAAVEMSRQQVQIFPIQFLKAEDLTSTIETVAPDVRIGVIKGENRLIVSAPPAQLAAVADLLKRLDVARQQVRITALLYDVDLEVMEQFGFNWSHSVKGRMNASGDPNSLFALNSNNFTATTATATDAAATAVDTAATAATTGSLGGVATLTNLSRHFDISTVIRTLDTTDGSRLLARPNIVAYDRMEAIFQSVSEIPVQQLTQTDAGGNIGTTSFREAGIKLTVTPQIMADGTILMAVMPEFSVLAGFQSGQPIIDKRSAITTIQLMNGQTTVIGGLLRRNELEKQSGLPGLSKMKYFGGLFRDHDTTVSESELLVFIKAEIVPMEQGNPPRDEAARMVADDLLEAVPYASHGPITPYCGDPYCPYHHPRPWGSNLPPSACTSCADGKSHGHGYTNYPEYYGPDVHGNDHLPTPATSHLPPSDEITRLETRSGNTSVPPPVHFDEARRRAYSSQRNAVRRLPQVNGGSGLRSAERVTPRLPSEQAQPFAPPRSNTRTATRTVQPLPQTTQIR